MLHGKIYGEKLLLYRSLHVKYPGDLSNQCIGYFSFVMADIDHPLCVLLSKFIEELKIQISILRDARESVPVPAACSGSACSSSAQQPISAPTISRNAQESVSKPASFVLPAMPAPYAYLLIELPPPEALQTLLQQQEDKTKMLAEIKDALQRLGQEFHNFQHTTILNNHARNQQLNQSHRIFNQFLPRR